MFQTYSLAPQNSWLGDRISNSFSSRETGLEDFQMILDWESRQSRVAVVTYSAILSKQTMTTAYLKWIAPAGGEQVYA